MRRFSLVVLLLLMLCPEAYAVLNEKDLSQTLSVLREELEMYQRDTRKNMAMGLALREDVHKRLMRLMNQSNQVALMLYSQKVDYIFDLTYACDKATSLYADFNKMKLPFDKVFTSLKVDEARYDGLIDNLQRMPRDILSVRELRDRDVCLTLCIALKRSLQNSSSELREYQRVYNMVGLRLKSLNDYALKRYKNIRESIFINGDNTYFDILSDLKISVMKAQYSIHEKYSSSDNRVKSQWRGPVVIGWFIFMIFYALVATGLNLAFIRFVMPGRLKTSGFREKEPCIIMTSTTVTFAALLMILWAFVLHHNFFLMASKLLIQYAWLLAVILISLLIRLDGKQIRDGFRIYSPLMVTGFLVITCRIIFIPNEVVNLTFPPLMLLTTLWQLYEIRRRQRNLPSSDTFFSSTTLVIMSGSFVSSWMGYTLLSVQLLVWWIMQFTCIQTITCIYDILGQYRKKHFVKKRINIRQTWAYDFIRKVLLPALMASSFFLSFYMATEVFSLSEICKYLFFTNFIDIAGVARVSLFKVLMVFSTFCLVRYLVYVFESFFALYNGGSKKTVTGEKALIQKVCVFVIWFLYIIIAMLGLHISTSGILVAMGGLSTGIGFAMKDTLENLFYGISLMTGRLHIGDIIECDGVRGQVVDISYQSTMIEALDGSIIAFLNNQLFSKNFKNLTRNHNYEVALIPIDVAYGTDINKARTCIGRALSRLQCYDVTRGYKIPLRSLEESAVELQIVIWVPVSTRIYSVGEIYEAVYNEFNANGISMPFPQRDIHIINDENEIAQASNLWKK